MIKLTTHMERRAAERLSVSLRGAGTYGTLDARRAAE